jgi:hypothetical protein
MMKNFLVWLSIINNALISDKIELMQPSKIVHNIKGSHELLTPTWQQKYLKQW